MLIIPAAAARNFAKTPEAMVLITGGIGVCSAIAGLRGAYIFDTPAGPSIVCVTLIFFVALSFLKLFVKK
jgi:zinc transport system permease protein